MKSAVDFIREFKLSSYGLDTWDVLIIICLMIGGCILFKWALSFISPTKAKLINNILTYTINFIVYGVWAFSIANSILTAHYGRAIVISFLMILPAITKWVASFYKRYDHWIDKIAERK